MHVELDRKAVKDLYRLAGLPPKQVEDPTPVEKSREKRQLAKRKEGKTAHRKGADKQRRRA